MKVSIRPARDASFSLKVDLGPGGTSSGLSHVQMSIVTMKSSVMRIPGKTPAMKSLPMDCSVRMP